MSITVLGLDGNPFDQNSIEVVAGRFLRTLMLLKLSGNYVTGGDVLDLTNGGGTPAAPSAVPTAQVRGLAQLDIRPFCKSTSSFSAADGQYFVLLPSGILAPVPIASVNALKLKLMLDIGTEYSAGAYGADALGDILQAEAVWVR
jgi:hypothetical protein